MASKYGRLTPGVGSDAAAVELAMPSVAASECAGAVIVGDDLEAVEHRGRWSQHPRARGFGVVLSVLFLAAAAVGTSQLWQGSGGSGARMRPGRMGAEALFEAGDVGDAVELIGVRRSKDKGFCHTARPPERCHADVIFAMKTAINDHPEWYGGLTNSSSFEEFQAFLHKQKDNNGRPRCPEPCGLGQELKPKSPTTHENKTCHDAVAGDDCWNHAKYTMKGLGEKIKKHPGWYPGLTSESTFADVQLFLHLQKVCPKPCSNATQRETEEDEDDWMCHHYSLGQDSAWCQEAEADGTTDGYVYDFNGGINSPCGNCHCCKMKQDNETDSLRHCHTTMPGEACFSDVWYMKTKEIKDHQDWYPGLTHNSSIEEFQVFLHEEHAKVGGVYGTQRCPMPCSLEALKNMTNKSEISRCHTAERGEPCFTSVLDAGREMRRLWSNKSAAGAVQTHYALQTSGSCTQHVKDLAECEYAASQLGLADMTSDPTRRDDWPSHCYWKPTNGAGARLWFNSVGGSCTTERQCICRFSTQVYENMTSDSTFEDIQALLHRVRRSESTCDHEPCSCHTAVKGEKCYKKVMYALQQGIEKHPKFYIGLTNKSTFEEVQLHLHARYQTQCELPCMPKVHELF